MTQSKAARRKAKVTSPPVIVMPKGKLGAIVQLLQASGGATIPDLMAATGWQAHSVRGAIAGALKKKLGLTITSEKQDGARIYRISGGTPA